MTLNQLYICILGRRWHLCQSSRRHFSSKLGSLDWNFLCDPANKEVIKENIERRKGVGNIDMVLSLKRDLDAADLKSKAKLSERLLREAARIPNRSHPTLVEYDSPQVIKRCGVKTRPDFKPATFESISSRLGLTRTDTSVYTGPRSYFLVDQLADLEAALVKYSVALLRKRGFSLVSVPDILPREVIEDCGMDTRGERSQVYSLGGDHLGEDLCLSGTAEMGISYLLKGKQFSSKELPKKIAAVSRCYRAETSKISEEKGIYRVHQFTKVEMYGVYLPQSSEKGLEEFRDIQEEIFSSLGLELQVLDMPECELGAQAYRKFDIEAYFPGKGRWGELSSASDCTDYQSRRLNITFDDGRYPHTINGTACAVPRAIVAIVETHQTKDGSVSVPKCLHPYLGYERIEKSRLPKLTPFKIKKKTERNKQPATNYIENPQSDTML